MGLLYLFFYDARPPEYQACPGIFATLNNAGKYNGTQFVDKLSDWEYYLIQVILFWLLLGGIFIVIGFFYLFGDYEILLVN